MLCGSRGSLGLYSTVDFHLEAMEGARCLVLDSCGTNALLIRTEDRDRAVRVHPDCPCLREDAAVVLKVGEVANSGVRGFKVRVA